MPETLAPPAPGAKKNKGVSVFDDGMGVFGWWIWKWKVYEVFEIFRDGIRKRGIEIVEEFTIIGFE